MVTPIIEATRPFRARGRTHAFDRFLPVITVVTSKTFEVPTLGDGTILIFAVGEMSREIITL